MAKSPLEPTRSRPPTSQGSSDASVVESSTEPRGSTVWEQGSANPVAVSPSGDETVPPPPGQLGRYRLDELLGKGGFGEVWRAFDPVLQRKVAIKFPRTDRAYPRLHAETLIDEARRVADLKIQGIAPVFDVGVEEGRLFVVFQFLEGGTLAERMSREKFTPEQSAQLIAEIAETLHQAHLHDLVHRDIKPANILFDLKGRSFVADFGLAISERELLRESGATLGTYAYMSPEQAAGESHRVDARADVYSLGVILFELLTQRLPYVAGSTAEYLDQVVHREPRPPRTIDDRIPRELEQICLKCLAKKPLDRYSTAKDLARDLTDRPQAPLPAGPSVWRALAASVALAIVCAASWGVYTVLSGPPKTNSPTKDATGSGVAKAPDTSRANSPDPAKPADLGVPRLPLEIDLPGRRATSQLIFDKAKDSYFLSSESVQLVRWGESLSADVTLDAELSQPNWGNRAGIFFGYREVPRLGKTWAVFEAVTLGEGPPNRPNGELRLHHCELSIHAQSQSVSSEGSFGFVDVPRPVDSRPRKLKVRLAEGRLKSVTWEGREYEVFPREIARIRPAGAKIPEGPWGIVNVNGTTTVRARSFIDSGE